MDNIKDQISVCGIQFNSVNGNYFKNRKNAEVLIRVAASKGVKLIVLPELALNGYVFDTSIWNYAEPLKGPTVSWLQLLADELGVYISTCIIERDSDNFFDTFVLVGPNHEFYFHRKVEAASFEAFYIKSAGLNTSVFDTKIGRIGVGICFDMNKRYVMDALRKQNPQILIATFCFPKLPAWLATKHQRENWEDCFKEIPYEYSRYLDCPVVAVNKTGSTSSTLPGLRFFTTEVGFVDRSCIVSRDGETLDFIDGEEGIVYANINLPERDRIVNLVPPKHSGSWVLKYSLASRILTNVSAFIGKIIYRTSLRKRKSFESPLHTINQAN